MQGQDSRGPVLVPLLIAALGVVLLLNNFLLLENFNVNGLLPLLLVVAGAQILLRGDLLPRAEGKTFAITRGSVQSGTLEISSGEIDVEIRALQKEGRLIAGQYAAESRPALEVDDTHTTLRFNRAATPWLSFADWQMAVARDLPWDVYISTHLGQVNADLSGVITDNVIIGTGVGDIRIVCPAEAFKPLELRSALGNIHVMTPTGYNTTIRAKSGRLFNVRFNETRYVMVADGVYVSREPDDDAPAVEIHISGTFGDAYLA